MQQGKSRSNAAMQTGRQGNVDQLPSHKCLSLCNAIQFAQDQHSLPRTCSTCTAHALLVR